MDKIEILSTDLLARYPTEVKALRSLSRWLGIGIGWHYLLDLTWMLENLGAYAGQRILDAGAGTGLLQFYLARHGAAEVISVDRVSRAQLSFRMRSYCRVRGLKSGDLMPSPAMARRNVIQAVGFRKIPAALRGMAGLLALALPKKGLLTIHHHDLTDLPAIADNSLDAVVAVSSLEHNSPEGLGNVAQELMRVLKPGGRLLATLGAARDRDWFHEPSRGWCYTEATLRRLFGLPADSPSNYDRFDELFARLKDCAELRDNLAAFYFQSGDNGMPWGKWEPQYQVAGVCRVKPG